MRLISWNVAPSALLVSIVVLIQLAILTVVCLEESDRDHFDKEKVVDQLINDIGTHAALQVADEDKSATFSSQRLGEYLVHASIGLKNSQQSSKPTNRELYGYLRPEIEMSLAWGIPAEKPNLHKIVKGVNGSDLKMPILDYFAYLYSIEKNKADQIKRDNILRMVGVFVGIITSTLFASWLLSRFARKHYLLAKPAQDHARTEPFWEFVTTVFPIITFKTTRWDALKFMKSQFRSRVAMVLMALCLFIAVGECQSRFKDYRRDTLFYSQLNREIRDAAYWTKRIASAEGDFHQSILIAVILASVMGSLFIVPKHLGRQDTDKGIAPTLAG